MTDLERYGRHAEECVVWFCACGCTADAYIHSRWAKSAHDLNPHDFNAQPCSCGFAEALLREGWQPIATAQKNGSWMLICRAGDGLIVMGQYHPDKEWRDYATMLISAPTHWQPLPAPPLPQGVSDVPHTE